MARWDEAQDRARRERVKKAEAELVEALNTAIKLVMELEGLRGIPGARVEPGLRKARNKLLEAAQWAGVQLHRECSAFDCHNTQDVVECWYDDGKYSLRINACLPCREGLERLGLLTVSNHRHRPGSGNPQGQVTG